MVWLAFCRLCVVKTPATLAETMIPTTSVMIKATSRYDTLGDPHNRRCHVDCFSDPFSLLVLLVKVFDEDGADTASSAGVEND